MNEEYDEHYKKTDIWRFYEKYIKPDKLRVHCHLPGKYRGPALQSCNINVTQKQSNFIPFVTHNFSIYDCHLFFKKLLDKKKDKLKFDFVPETNEE